MIKRLKEFSLHSHVRLGILTGRAIKAAKYQYSQLHLPSPSVWICRAGTEIYYDDDADIEIIRKLNVTIVGYGSQGHAHANNLKDSGVNVTVALREGSSSWNKAVEAGLNVMPVAESIQDADLVMMLAPDEFQKGIYDKNIQSNLKSDAILAFAHGFNIHFEKIIPEKGNSVIMIAPKGPGHTVRSTYLKGGGVPSLVATFR